MDVTFTAWWFQLFQIVDEFEASHETGSLEPKGVSDCFRVIQSVPTGMVSGGLIPTDGCGDEAIKPYLTELPQRAA